MNGSLERLYNKSTFKQTLTLLRLNFLDNKSLISENRRNYLDKL